MYEPKHPNGCLNSLRCVSLGTTSLWQGALAGNWNHYKGKIGDIFLSCPFCLFLFLSQDPFLSSSSLLCLFSHIISLYKQTEDRLEAFVDSKLEQSFFFTLITFLPLFPYVLSHLSLKWVTVWFCVSISSEWGKEGQSERKLGQCATVHNSNTYTGALPAHIQKPSQRSDVKQWFYFFFFSTKRTFLFLLLTS